MPPTTNKHKRSRQAAAVALLLLALGGAAALVVAPLAMVFDSAAEEIADLEFRLGRYNRIKAGKQYWTDNLRDIRQAQGSEQRLLNADTPALASADLQTLLKEAITSAGGNINSTQVVPARQEDHFTRITVRVRMSGSIEALQQVLHQIESSTPYLLVDNMTITASAPPPPPPMRSPADKPRPPPARKPLNVDFEVYGYMRAS